MRTSICPLKLRRGDKLIENLLRKKKLLEAGDPEHAKYKTALIVEGGFMLGVYGAGVVMGLEKAGLTDAFDYIIGTSAGAGAGAYFLSGQSALGTSIFYEDLTDRRFINYFRPKKVVDLTYLESLMRTTKKLDTDKVRSSRSTLLIPVTNANTGKGEILSSKDLSIDIVDAIVASCCLPELAGRSIALNRKHYYDGTIGFPYPIEYATRELDCTDVVVVTNRNCDCREDSFFPFNVDTLAINTIMRNSKIHDALVSREMHYGHDMSILWNDEPLGDVNLGLICRNKLPISAFSQNRKRLRNVAMRAKEQTFELFSTPEPH